MPTKKEKADKVVIVGCAETTFKRAEKHFGQKHTEIIGINQLYKNYPEIVKHATRWYQIHHKDEVLVEHPDSWDWLKKQKFPVYVQEQYSKESKNFKVFPKDDILHHRIFKRRYFTSIIAWIMAHVIMEKPKEIYLYGMDFALRKEYLHQRPNTEWLIGVCDGLGIECVVPKQCDMMKAATLYAYEDSVGVLRKVQNEIKRFEDKKAKYESAARATRSLIDKSIGMRDMAELHKIGKDSDREFIDKRISDLEAKEHILYLQASEASGLIRGIKYMGQDWHGIIKQEL